MELQSAVLMRSFWQKTESTRIIIRCPDKIINPGEEFLESASKSFSGIFL